MKKGLTNEVKELIILQTDKILIQLFKTSDRFVKASELMAFQSNELYVGYETTARMSDVLRTYPKACEVKKEGRFRTLKINKTKFKKEYPAKFKYINNLISKLWK